MCEYSIVCINIIYIFFLISQVIRLFNLFITYGDTFLPSPTAYDELYYELIRVRQLFDGLYQLGESETDRQNKERERYRQI